MSEASFAAKLTKVYDINHRKSVALTVVMIHGIAADSTSFEKALAYLSGIESMKKIRFVTFDLLGSGRSVKNDELDYGYKGQIEALHNAIQDLEIETPIILVGHSMGTLVVTRYAKKYPEHIKKLILISPPIYTEKDLNNPAFAAGIKMFKEAVSVKNRKILEEKAFNDTMNKIVLKKDNYKTLLDLSIPKILIYGDLDQFIASYNLPRAVRDGCNMTAIKTSGRHGVSRDKYTVLGKILEEELNEII